VIRRHALRPPLDGGLAAFAVLLGGLCLVVVVVVVQFAAVTSAAQKVGVRKKHEVDHAKDIAKAIGGEVEHRLPDGSRVDILTDEIAWEVDWCRTGKWAEGCGQAIFYGLATNRKPGLILLMRDPDRERRYYLRALAVCAEADIEIMVWRVRE
jgi:hypothetical protein